MGSLIPLFLEASQKSAFAIVRFASLRVPCWIGFGAANEKFIAFVPHDSAHPIESVAVMETDYLDADSELGAFTDVRARVLFRDGALHVANGVGFEFFVTRNYLETRHKTGA